MEILYYCPKCNGENITQEAIDFPEPKRISMLEAYVPFHIHTLVYETQKYKLTCNDCGFSVEFTQ